MDVEGSPGIFAPTYADNQFLYQSGVSIYNADKRSRKDVGFTVTYVLLSAVAAIWGIVAFASMDKNHSLYTIGFYENSSTCDIQKYNAAHPRQTDAELTIDATFARAFNKAVAIFLPISAGLALVSSVLYLVLFRRFAKATVFVSIGLSVAFTLALGIASIIMGSPIVGVILIIMSVIAAIFYYFIRRNLALCAELMALSARALYENAALVPTAVLIKVLGAGILVYGAAAFACALQVGDVIHNPAVFRTLSLGETGVCYDTNGLIVDCCVFKPRTWAVVYCIFDAIFIWWTTMFILEIKLYTVADTLSQWYFSTPASGSTAVVGVTSSLTRGSVRQALRHCLTTSFGSVAFASAIITLINILRRVLQRAARNNIVCCIINCIAQPILALLQKFTSFATIATAITGQAFLPAARAVFDTLTKNFLQTYSVWWVPDRVLGFTVFLFSLSWGGIVFGSTYGMTKNNDYNTKWGVPALVGMLCFLMMAYVLSFVAGLLLDAINTMYICFAFDKDQRRVTHPEVHSLFAQVPGLTVENPDGNIMYGAPEPAPEPQRYTQQYPPQQYPPQQYLPQQYPPQQYPPQQLYQYPPEQHLPQKGPYTGL
ncbi:hypothetical protein Vretimale_835 [Volvox reticuliferus]|uniref:Choline transporter-like protein n=1 Tax=Volvox reticuliferus TaxID=1737510 RepID=A0A8J4D435_9CHLO|nr:hypothetical protein Vretifemale_2240 [Volvox reticuliferus]GIL94604.1 hypothetical protein Vretimale_835 [Volvox reticuliferus]